jgi:peptide/nickel transport system permease protein
VTAYIARRLLALVPLMLLVSFGVFGLVLLIPGDPAITIAGGTKAQPAQVAQVRHLLHEDEPFLQRYGGWLGRAARGDLGQSIYKNRAVAADIRARFPVTVSLALGALVITLLLGVPAGIAAGTRPGSLIDRIITVGSSAAIAIPDFWLGMVLVVVFAVNLNVLPAIGYVPFARNPVDWATHLYLPWFALGLANAAALARQMRGALIDVLEQDYIRTADAKGLRRSVIIGKHALKNASIAPVTVLGLQFAYLLGGTVIIEQIFSIPGMGQYFYQALLTKDLPVIQGMVLVVALTFVLLNLFVDVLYAYLNPKVRLA